MSEHPSRRTIKHKEDHRTQQARERTLKQSVEVDEESPDASFGYARAMRNLLRDPVSLGLKGGYRGHQR